MDEERILIAKKENSFVVFDGFSGHFTESNYSSLKDIVNEYCSTSENKIKFIEKVYSTKLETDPNYWQVFDPLEDSEFNQLLDLANNYKD
ncbi:hypothetical protein K9L97_04870 [Candidatus Woesearchaeota archaeon]|nr:hypothetical protein [Candidatus Woesearchaeota archaeon]